MDIKAKQLLDILFDTNARLDERDDAAIYLDKYLSTDVLEALINFARNEKEEYLLLSSVGETIGEIMIKTNYFDINIINSLASTAKSEALGIISGKKAEWLKEKK